MPKLMLVTNTIAGKTLTHRVLVEAIDPTKAAVEIKANLAETHNCTVDDVVILRIESQEDYDKRLSAKPVEPAPKPDEPVTDSETTSDTATDPAKTDGDAKKPAKK